MNREPESCRILLVEDDAALASMVADFLSPQGFEVAIEGRGDTAVHRITGENPESCDDQHAGDDGSHYRRH